MGNVSLISAFITIVAFLTFLSVMDLILPPKYQVIQPFDLIWFGGGIIGVASACVIATGIPCAGALAIYSIASLFNYLVVNVSILKTVVFLPLSIVMIYIVARLARGG